MPEMHISRRFPGRRANAWSVLHRRPLRRNSTFFCVDRLSRLPGRQSLAGNPALQSLPAHALLVAGVACPPPHPDFRQHYEELLFHRSRYYFYTQNYLQNISGNHDFSLADYEPGRLSFQQRRLLAVLLASPPDRQIARAIAAVVIGVIKGGAGVDARLWLSYGECRLLTEYDNRERKVRHPAVRPAQDIDPTDPIINFAERFGVPVEVSGRQLKLPLGRLQRLVAASSDRARNLLDDFIYDLQSAGYAVLDCPDLKRCR